LFVAVTIVLLIACVNVSSLLLVRAIRQRREYALRVALGASSARIIRKSVIEGVLLSTAGGLLGLAFATITIRMALDLLPDSMPRINSISINPIVGGFALAVAVSSGIVCSLPRHSRRCATI
jgi:ABC-type antimicrobial peptide transport system permease subunit